MDAGGASEEQMEQTWKQAKAAFAAISAPPILWLLLFFIIPMAVIWAYSFGENVGPIDIDFTGTFRNYTRALEPLYLDIFWKSLIVAGLTTLLCLIVGFPVALAIAFASPRTKAWLLLLIMLPFWTNLLIRTFALIAVLREQGYVNFALEWLWNNASGLMALIGLQPLGEFQPLTLLYNNTAVVVGLVYVHLPFMVLPLYSALDRMDRSLMEASLDLGAGHLRTIWSVVVPLAAPGIASGVLITFIPALGAYLTPDLLGGTDSQMIANVIERQFKRANDWPFGAALSFLLMYLTFIAIAAQAFVQRKSERRG
jgi:spermidine/putrescine transport system permease protein